MNKFKIVLVIAFSCLVAFLLTLFKPEVEKARSLQKGMLVEVFSAKPESPNMIVETYGTVEPKESLKFIAEVSGKITQVSAFFVEGGYVAKGTKLLTIDRRSFELGLKSAAAGRIQTEAALAIFKQNVINLQSSIKIAQADFRLAKAEFMRINTLFGKKVIAKTALDKAKQVYIRSLNNLDNLNNQLKLSDSQHKELLSRKSMADVAQEQAKLQLQKTVITAPFNGYILEKIVKNGEYVNPGAYLGSLYKENSFEVTGNIAQKDLEWIVPGINIKPLDAEVIFDNLQNKITWQAKAVRTKSAVDIHTRTLPVVIQIDAEGFDNKKKAMLRPGIFVKILIKGKKENGIYILPVNLIGENNTVNIAEKNRLVKKQVEIIRIFKDKAYITKGIDAQDFIIKTDIAGASEGMQVRTSYFQRLRLKERF
ncbi:MAG: HlyD family efflux transporter periplasmic adaptor subunit [Deltaproteobacteria bacterium]|nr:HlyD family efflux transporter periplasmic adaptor subunit [Deltaproteobacteria bacterium]